MKNWMKGIKEIIIKIYLELGYVTQIELFILVILLIITIIAGGGYLIYSDLG